MTNYHPDVQRAYESHCADGYVSTKSIPTASARIIFTDSGLDPVRVPKFARFEVENGSLAAYAVDTDGDLSIAAVVAAGQWAYLAVTDDTAVTA